jgi:histidine triad (HIT) family protein
MPNDCLFCKIIKGEVPSTEVVSTPDAYAFRDIDPQAPSHVVVVPRHHVADADHLDDGDGDLLAGVFAAAREVARKEGLTSEGDTGGYRLVLNVGKDASNSVGHLHMHVLGGRPMGWPPG